MERDKNDHYLGIIVCCTAALLAAALVIFVRYRLLTVPFERDEGEYAYIAQLLLKGYPPYQYAYTMKLPGVPFCYALFMLLFGQTVAAIHGGLLLVNTASTLLLYRLGRRLYSCVTGLTAAACFALLSLSRSVMGASAHATHLVVFFSLLGIWLLTSARGRWRLGVLCAAGLSLGLAVLMKQHAVLLIPLLILIRPAATPEENRSDRHREHLVFLVAAALPYLAVMIWMTASGLFARFWFWTVSYAGQYASGLPFSAGMRELSLQFSPVLQAHPLIWMTAATGVAFLLREWRTKTNGRFLLAYLLVSLLMVTPGFYFRPHYFVLLLPPVALLAGLAIATGSSYLPKPLGRLSPAIFLLFVLGSFCTHERDYLFRYTPEEVSRSIYGANPFTEAAPIAAYIRSHSNTDDRVAVLGSEPEILFYADRLSATGHIYMYGLMEEHRYAGEMQRQVMAEIEHNAPRFIVVVHIPVSWLLRPNSQNGILDWADAYIPPRYEEMGIVDCYEDRPARFAWEAAANGYEPESDAFIAVYRRRW